MQTRNFTFYLFLLLFPILLPAQDYVYRTFKDTRVINAHSVEVLPKRKLDIRIGHRFGDMFGESGGWQTFYGLENAADVLIGGEYGVSDRLTLGGYRSKGGGNLSQLVNGLAKVSLLRQKEDVPASFSLTALGVLTFSTMPKSDNPEAINFFDKTTHRMSYTVQLLLSRKFSDRFSLQFSPSFTHRNIVPFGDTNDIFSIGGAARLQLTKVLGLIVDVALPLNGEQSPITRSPESEYHIPLGIGFEFDTGGHIFQVNLTNTRGMIESDYLVNTTSDWLEGEFRLGFTISRLFNIR